MNQFRIIFAIITILPFLLANPLSARSEDDFVLTGLGVDNQNGTVRAGFHILVNNIDPLQDALESGSVFELTCAGELYSKRPAMWDKLIATGRYVCTISANPLAKECILDDGVRRHTVSFDSLRKDLIKQWTGLSLPLGSWNMIERNSVYRVVLKMKIVRKNVPQWVSNTLFFVDWELLPETAYELEFDY